MTPSGSPAAASRHPPPLGTATVVVGTAVLAAFLMVKAMSSFQADSEWHVVSMLLMFQQGGTFPPNGFLCSYNSCDAYTSQFGLQGLVFGVLFKIANNVGLPILLANAKTKQMFGGGPPSLVFTFFVLMKLLITCLAAGVFMFWVTRVHRDLGRAAAAVAFVAIAASPLIGGFSGNLYWVGITLFLPFIAAWCLAPGSVGDVRRARTLAFWVGFFVFLKSMCGYEFLSNVVLAAMVPVVFFGLREGAAPQRVLAACIRIGLASTVGFIVAVVLHVVSMSRGLTIGQGLEIIKGRAAFRMVGNDSAPWPEVGAVAANYLNQMVLALPGGRLGVPLWLFLIAVVLVLVWGAMRARRLAARPAPRWYHTAPGAATAGMLTALIASASWLLPGYQHTMVHAHMNLILVYLPLVPALAAMIPGLAKLGDPLAWRPVPGNA